MADITHLQGTVGQANAASGVSHAVTMTRNTGLRLSNSQATFQDAVERGRAYGVANQTGVASQAGLSATTPVLTLANPASSGVNAVIWFVAASFSVAVAAAAGVLVAVGTNTVAAAVTGTLTTTHRNLKLGVTGGNKVIPYLAATLPAAPVAVSVLGTVLTGAITVSPSGASFERWFNGGIILQPGTNLSIQTTTASGASGMFCEFLWEEVDV